MSAANKPSASAKKTTLSNATCQVTRAVQTMSSFHQSTSMTGTFRDTYRFYFYSPKHFPKILGGIMVLSGIAGYSCMGWYHDRTMEERKRIYVEAYHHNNGVGASSSTLATNSSLVSSSEYAKNNINGDGDNNRLVSLARKMTHRTLTLPNSEDTYKDR